MRGWPLSRGWTITLGAAVGLALTVQFANAFEPTASSAPAQKAGAMSDAKARAKSVADSLTWPLPEDCTVPVPNPGIATVPADDPFNNDLLTEAASPAHTPTLKLRRLYEVYNGALRPIDGIAKVRHCDAEVWRILQASTPTSLQQHLEQLMLFDAPPGQADPDQPSDWLLGEVEHVPGDPFRWRIGLRLNETPRQDLLMTMAHEIGHLVSLAPDQLRPSTIDECVTYEISDGCLLETAYLNRFVAYAWQGDAAEVWEEADDIEDEADRTDALYDLYDEFHEDFVSDYATTSREEDFAETFSYWCVFGGTEWPGGEYNGTDGARKRAHLESMEDLRLLTGQSCALLRELAGR